MFVLLKQKEVLMMGMENIRKKVLWKRINIGLRKFPINNLPKYGVYGDIPLW